MPVSEHESWRYVAQSGTILGPNGQVVAQIEDGDRSKIGPVFVKAFKMLEDLSECFGESMAETRKRYGLES